VDARETLLDLARLAARAGAADAALEEMLRLIADALAGDSTLFIRSDEAEEAWRVVDALEAAWAKGPAPQLYPAGSAGL